MEEKGLFSKILMYKFTVNIATTFISCVMVPYHSSEMSPVLVIEDNGAFILGNFNKHPFSSFLCPNSLCPALPDTLVKHTFYILMHKLLLYFFSCSICR